jgi:hypothetical protein
MLTFTHFLSAVHYCDEHHIPIEYIKRISWWEWGIIPE